MQKISYLRSSQPSRFCSFQLYLQKKSSLKNAKLLRKILSSRKDNTCCAKACNCHCFQSENGRNLTINLNHFRKSIINSEEAGNFYVDVSISPNKHGWNSFWTTVALSRDTTLVRSISEATSCRIKNSVNLRSHIILFWRDLRKARAERLPGFEVHSENANYYY